MKMAMRRRVISLLPSATEVLDVIGGIDLLVGRSHECDFPKGLDDIPVLTSQRTTFTSSKDVDDQVREALSSGESLYSIDEDMIRKLEPDVILTQSLCSVCSIDLNAVVKLAKQLEKRPRIISLNPRSLQDVLDSFLEVGDAVGMLEEAKEARVKFQARVDEICGDEARIVRRRNIAFVEWIDPIYVGGHWTPELIEMVGSRQGVNPEKGKNSFAIDRSTLMESNPDAIIICPCGLNLEKAEEEYNRSPFEGIKDIPLVFVDGNEMFNRPGPRLLDCLEFLSRFVQDDYMGIDPRFPWKTGNPKAEQIFRHQQAMVNGDKMYIDPETGYSVFTEQAALDRGICCGNSCRHCPYGRFKTAKKDGLIYEPRLLKNRKKTADYDCVLFWSGGKDSYLTYLELKSQNENQNILLLTTFDPEHQIVPIQNIVLKEIMEQAQHLKCDLVVIPVTKEHRYSETVRLALKELPCEVSTLVFGDLHLEDIRKWRESQFAQDYKVLFPLFGKPYDVLKETLSNAPVEVFLSNVLNQDLEDLMKPGDSLQFQNVPTNIDLFGENGEYHTLVKFIQ